MNAGVASGVRLSPEAYNRLIGETSPLAASRTMVRDLFTPQVLQLSLALGRSRYPPLDPSILEPMKSKSLFVIKEMMQYKFVDELKTVSGLNSSSLCNAQCDPFSSMIASIVNAPNWYM